jgi:methionyl-tRNA formyltransferase
MAKDCVRQLYLTKSKLPAKPQPEQGVTYAPILSRDDGRIDWNKPAIETDRQIRALNPWPGTWTTLDGKRIKILKAEIVEESVKQKPGTLVDRSGLTACGNKTAIRIHQLQPEGKKPMDTASAINGGLLEEGKVFG